MVTEIFDVAFVTGFAFGLGVQLSHGILEVLRLICGRISQWSLARRDSESMGNRGGHADIW
jgi:hypothetical protein